MRTTKVIAGIVLLLSAQVASAEDPVVPGPIATPSEEQLAIFRGSPEDPAPAERHRIHHYYAGNEDFLDLFKEDVLDLGGGYIGVGSDQAYLFIGWARPEWAWLIDYDDAIPPTHLIHFVLIGAAQNGDELIALWGKKSEARAKELLTAAYQGDRLTRVLKTYKNARPKLEHRLKWIRKIMQDRKVSSYLDDQVQYDYVKQLIQAGRVRAMVTNLLDTKGVIGIGEAARQLGVVIRVYYPSNAEQYWDYSKEYRDNVRALPIDERSVLVRTSTVGGNDYTYLLQKMENYLHWMASPKIRHIRFIRPSARSVLKGRNLTYQKQVLRFQIVEKLPKPDQPEKPGKKQPKKKAAETAQAPATP